MKCPKCGKEVKDFGNGKHCKDCINKRNRKYYKNNKEKILKQKKEYQKKNREKFKERRTEKKRKFNGLSDVWRAMKERCYYSKNNHYNRYGGRGITVCKEWKDSFLTFYKWAKDKHEKGLQIDRRDNDGNYCPENCRFVTGIENIRNCSATKLSEEKVRKIRKLLEEGELFQSEIGKLFGVRQGAISSIKRRKAWKEVKNEQSYI